MYYAAIKPDDLRMSGVFETDNINNVLCKKDSATKAPSEGYGFIFIPCHNWDEAKQRVRLETLERTQAELIMLYCEKAMNECESDIARLLGNLNWLSDCKEQIKELDAHIQEISTLRSKAVPELTEYDIVCPGVFGVEFDNDAFDLAKP